MMRMIFNICEGLPPVMECQGPALLAIPLIGSFTVGSAVALSGAALGAVSAISASRAKETQLRGQAQAAEFNQRIAEQNVEISRGQTDAQLETADRERRLRIGANIAAAGATGGVTGSTLDILQDNVTQENLNILTIQQEGLLKERSLALGGQLQGQTAQLARAQTPGVRTAGTLKAASTILGAAGNL